MLPKLYIIWTEIKKVNAFLQKMKERKEKFEEIYKNNFSTADVKQVLSVSRLKKVFVFQKIYSPKVLPYQKYRSIKIYEKIKIKKNVTKYFYHFSHIYLFTFKLQNLCLLQTEKGFF